MIFFCFNVVCCWFRVLTYPFFVPSPFSLMDKTDPLAAVEYCNHARSLCTHRHGQLPSVPSGQQSEETLLGQAGPQVNRFQRKQQQYHVRVQQWQQKWPLRIWWAILISDGAFICVHVSGFNPLHLFSRLWYLQWPVSVQRRPVLWPTGGNHPEGSGGPHCIEPQRSQRLGLCSEVHQTAHPWEAAGAHRTGAPPSGCQRALRIERGSHWPLCGARGRLWEHGAAFGRPLPRPHFSADFGVEAGVRWPVAKNPRTF